MDKFPIFIAHPPFPSIKIVHYPSNYTLHMLTYVLLVLLLVAAKQWMRNEKLAAGPHTTGRPFQDAGTFSVGFPTISISSRQKLALRTHALVLRMDNLYIIWNADSINTLSVLSGINPDVIFTHRNQENLFGACFVCVRVCVAFMKYRPFQFYLDLPLFVICDRTRATRMPTFFYFLLFEYICISTVFLLMLIHLHGQRELC